MTLECLDYAEDEAAVEYRWEAPTLSIVHRRHFFELAGTYYRKNGSCQQELANWRAVIAGQEQVCVLAAYPQEMPLAEDVPWDSHSYWVVDRIKSLAGTVIAISR